MYVHKWKSTMFDIFDQAPYGSAVVSIPSQWEYIKRHVAANVKTYVEYYQSSSAYSPSQNVLVDILYGLGVNTSLPVEEYAQLVKSKALTLTAGLGMVNAMARGRPTKPFFYGRRFDDCDEVVIATDNSFDVQQAYDNWRSVQAVTVVSHGITSLELPAPFEAPTSADHSLVVIAVNVPMLAVQYKAFRDSQKGVEDTAGIQSFLARFVGPNMIYSHLEQCWINRVIAKARRMEIRDKQYARPPFTLMNIASYFDSALNQTVDNLQRLSRPSLTNFYRNVPSLFHDNALLALRVPDVVPTYNVDWVLSCSRLKHVMAPLVLLRDEAARASSDELVQIVRSLRVNQVLQYALTGLSRDGYLTVTTQVDRIMQFHGA